MVDKVYKFEDLDGAMADIYQRLDISGNSQLLQTKTSDRNQHTAHYTMTRRAKLLRWFVQNKLLRLDINFSIYEILIIACPNRCP